MHHSSNMAQAALSFSLPAPLLYFRKEESHRAVLTLWLNSKVYLLLKPSPEFRWRDADDLRKDSGEIVRIAETYAGGDICNAVMG